MSTAALNGQTLAAWREKYERLRSAWWPRMQRVYHAEVHGPTKFEGPTLIVLDRHERSTDPPLFACVESYCAPAARRDSTFLSRMAEAIGGPIYDETKAGTPQMSIGRQILFHMQEGSTILVFPFTDVHRGELSTRVLELVFNLEAKGKIGAVDYVPATVRYAPVHPLIFPARFRVVPSYRPFPFITKAKVFISDSPVRTADLEIGRRNIGGLVSTIFEQAATLPDRYMVKG